MKKILTFLTLFVLTNLALAQRSVLVLTDTGSGHHMRVMSSALSADTTIKLPLSFGGGISTVYGLAPVQIYGGDTVGVNLSAGAGIAIAAGATFDTIKSTITQGVTSIIGGTGIAVATNGTIDTIKYTGIDTAHQAGTGITINYGAVRDTFNLSVPVSIANGGTNATTANAGFNALSPMTTLGDVTYEDNTPKAVRLAGNTTSTKNFLVQTGTGTVSAAPTWGTIAVGDVPTLNQNTTGSAGSAPAGTLTGTTLASNVVTSSLTTVGTIGTGTWNGTTIATANGGTGTTSAGTQFGVTYYTTTTAMASTAAGTTGQFLGANTAGAPTWQTPSAGVSQLFAVAPLTVGGTDTVHLARWIITGTNNEMLGNNAGTSLKAASSLNVVIGDSAAFSDTGGASNVIIGANAYQTVKRATGAGGSVVIGQGAAQHGGNNIGNSVIVGQSCSPYDNGSSNVIIGKNSGSSAGSINTGSNNVFVGYDVQNDNGSGNDNVEVGALVGVNAGNSSNNTIVGYDAGTVGGGSHDNTCFGWECGGNTANYTFCTTIGNSSLVNGALTNATALGYNATVNASNTVQLGNTSVTMVNTSGGLTTGGKIISQSVTKSANYTFDASGTDYIVQETGNGTTVTLPATATNGRECVVIFDNTTAANTMTVSGNGHNIDGAANVTLSAKTSISITIVSSIRVVGDGTNWWIEAGF